MGEECAGPGGEWRLQQGERQELIAKQFGYASMALNAWKDLVRRILWARELGVTANEPAAVLLVDEAANVARLIAYGVLCGDIKTALAPMEPAKVDAPTSGA